MSFDCGEILDFLALTETLPPVVLNSNPISYPPVPHLKQKLGRLAHLG